MARSKASLNGRTSNRPLGNQSAYFRDLYKKNRRFLRMRSNKSVLKMWLNDHPGYSSVPDNARQALANVKGDMRKSMRTRRTNAEMAAGIAGADGASLKKPRHLSKIALEKLEIIIDECVIMATNLDRDALADVISALRIARRRVPLTTGME